MSKNQNKVIELLICVMGSGGAVWSFLKGGLSFIGSAYAGPIGGFLFSLAVFIFLIRLIKQHKNNPYIPPIAKLFSIVVMITAISFLVSAILLPYYNRSWFGEKGVGRKDSIIIQRKADYKVRTESKNGSSVELLFFTDDQAVKELIVMPSFTRPKESMDNTVDHLSVKTTSTKPKKKGFIFLDVKDADGCDVAIRIDYGTSQQQKVIVDVVYTYYNLPKSQELLRWLLERYYV